MLVYTLPFIGALIGWFTNYIAIKMLFHPRDEVRIFFIPIQGVFPRRQKDLPANSARLYQKNCSQFRI